MMGQGIGKMIPILPKASLKERIDSLKGGIWAILPPAIIIGGMLGGFFTPTEALAVATAYGLIVGFDIYRELKFASLPASCYRVLISSSTVMYHVALPSVYTFALTRERLPEMVTNFLFGLSTSPLLVRLIILVFIILLGMSLSTTPALNLSIPLFVPFLAKMGFDPIWFYALVTIALCMGTLTPLVALTLYLKSQMAGTSPEKTFVRMFPQSGLHDRHSPADPFLSSNSYLGAKFDVELPFTLHSWRLFFRGWDGEDTPPPPPEEKSFNL